MSANEAQSFDGRIPLPFPISSILPDAAGRLIDPDQLIEIVSNFPAWEGFAK
jgi:hypothetical protein